MEQKIGKLEVFKSTLKGDISIPPSKSHTLRAILFGALGKGTSRIYNYLDSPDTTAMIEACRTFGAQIEIAPTHLIIQGTSGKIEPHKTLIHVGNSGIVLRFCAALSALSSVPITLTGDHSICTQRPMTPLLEGLCQLGASASSVKQNGYAPVTIQGVLKGGFASISGEDSQPVSALLIAASFAKDKTCLCVENPGEKPWVGLTLDWFDRLGIEYTNANFTDYTVWGNTTYAGFDYTVPGDHSSAAFPIAAALITDSEVLIRNIDLRDSQGDKELIFLLEKMGACFEIQERDKTLLVKRGAQLCGISADINNYIDAITILAVLACYATGETHIRNAAIAKHKECNRIHCITTELRKMGALITETEDGLKVRGSALKGTSVHTYHDHRMALSLAVAALGAEGPTHIDPVECITKTFPSFVTDFKRLGAKISLLPLDKSDL